VAYGLPISCKSSIHGLPIAPESSIYGLPKIKKTSKNYNDQYTRLYLPFDGTFTNYARGASEPHTATNYGMTFSSAIRKKGRSAYGTGSEYIVFPASADWVSGTNPFTIHLWVYPISNSFWIVENLFNGTNVDQFYVSSGAVNWYCYRSAYKVRIYTGAVVTTGAWHHIAAVRDGDNYYIFVDGQTQALTQAAFTASQSWGLNATFQIGMDNGTGTGINGYFDQFYFDNGIARWTADFTPP